MLIALHNWEDIFSRGNLIYGGRINGILRFVDTLKSTTYVVIRAFKSNRMFGMKYYNKSIGKDQ